MNSTERILYVSGSPRSRGNTDYLLNALHAELSGTLIRLSDYRIEHCKSCWSCLDSGRCAIADDMRAKIIPALLKCDAVVLGSPVFFNNVTADMKAFMDRTWCLRGQLRNKVGGTVVVGRRYGPDIDRSGCSARLPAAGLASASHPSRGRRRCAPPIT